MFQDYQQQISENRKSIRDYYHHKHIYVNCLGALKNEKTVFKKAEIRLKKLGFGAELDKTLTLRQIFETILKDSGHQKKKTPRILLYTKLNQMAGSSVIDYLTERVAKRDIHEISIKPLERMERRILKEFDKYLTNRSIVQSHKIINLTLKIENLNSDLKEIDSARQLGKEAQNQLNQLNKLLKAVDNWGVWELSEESGTVSGSDPELTNQLFNQAVNAHMLLCAFKNELRVFSEGRDLMLHLEAIADFKNTFFNHLIVDWIDESKIKLSAVYVRKTLNSLEALLQGVESKNIKIESERTITMREQSAILEQIEKQQEKKL